MTKFQNQMVKFTFSITREKAGVNLPFLLYFEDYREPLQKIRVTFLKNLKDKEKKMKIVFGYERYTCFELVWRYA